MSYRIYYIYYVTLPLKMCFNNPSVEIEVFWEETVFSASSAIFVNIALLNERAVLH